MNKKQYQRTEGMVKRYLTLQDNVRTDGLVAHKLEMALLCYDMIRVISDLRVEYRKREMERRLRRYERTK